MAWIHTVLQEGLERAAWDAEMMTGRSLNDLPEYYMAVKVAEHIAGSLTTYSFSLEDPIERLAAELGIENFPAEFRGGGNADLVLRSAKTGRLKHVVEFKRSISTGEIKKDALRLAKLCMEAPAGHRAEKNFLVAVSHMRERLKMVRAKDIQDWLKEADMEAITVKTFQPDFAGYMSTRTSRRDTREVKPLIGMVWQFEFAS